jgi:hypothetical protein
MVSIMKNLSILSAAAIMTVSLILISCNQKSSDNSSGSLLLLSPLVLSTTPANGAINVPVGSQVVVTFSQTISPTTVTSATFNFSPAISGTYTTAGPVVYFTPTGSFLGATAYTVTIPAGGIAGTNGFHVILQHQFSFTTF